MLAIPSNGLPPSDGPANVASARTLGTGPLDAMAGNATPTPGAGTVDETALTTGLRAVQTDQLHTCDRIQVATGVAYGTGAGFFSLSDAALAGAVAGGSMATSATTGTLGWMAPSFASDAAEQNTGAGQGGLGSATATTQPLNASDFPGQTPIASPRRHVLLKADQSVLVAGDVLSPAAAIAAGIADVETPVYGVLSFRSDKAADSKWRMWLYSTRTSDGAPVPITPTIAVTGGIVLVIKVELLSLRSGLAGLSGPTATAVGADIAPNSITTSLLAFATNIKSLLNAADYGAFRALLGAAGAATIVSSATPAINTDAVSFFSITALALAITSFTTNLTGTPYAGQHIIIRILDNGAGPYAIAWGAKFASRGVALPITTVSGKYLRIGLEWNEVTTTWDCIAATTEV
jgi:hypothetical protein